MYQAKQQKEKVSRTISQLDRKSVRKDSASKDVMQYLVRKDNNYYVNDSFIDEKFKELDNIQKYALEILYKHLTPVFPITHARFFCSSVKSRNNFMYSYWGYCVEEMMNKLLENSEWQRQVPLSASRPDYGLEFNNCCVYADSTSNNTSIKEDTHIGNKLKKSKVKGNVAAADIAYPDNSIVNMINSLHARSIANMHYPTDRMFMSIPGIPDYYYTKLAVYEEVRSRLGKIRHKELMQIAMSCSKKTEIKINRDTKRSKIGLLKWFAENWMILRPFIT